MSDMLIFNGGAVKAMGQNKVGGYLCYFTSELEPDLQGDFFDRKSDFWLEDRKALPVVFGHGSDKVMGKRRIGSAAFKMDEVGVWIDAQIEGNDRWIEAIIKLVKEGKLSWSSGAIGHLVQRVKKAGANWLKTWPLSEASLTPAPAAPYGTQAISLKFYSEPSLKEMVRRAGMSEAELLREEGKRICERAEAALDWVAGGPAPDRWANDQVMRGANNNESRAARADWLKMGEEAKAKLAGLDALEKTFGQLIAEQGRTNKMLTPQFAPGAWPRWANR